MADDLPEALFDLLSHRFAAPDLLREALTHPSTSGQERAAGDYERLEFVGDRVLGLVIAARLFREDPDAREGDLAVRYNALVRRETLAEAAAGLGLGQYLRLGRSEEEQGGRDKPSILANAFEAVVGALYFDGGLEVARQFIEAALAPQLDENGAAKDPKTRLQELVQASGGAPPDYRVLQRTGPDHAPRFVVEVRSAGQAPQHGEAGSRRAAEQAAARAMLEAMHDGA